MYIKRQEKTFICNNIYFLQTLSSIHFFLQINDHISEIALLDFKNKRKIRDFEKEKNLVYNQNNPQQKLFFAIQHHEN